MLKGSVAGTTEPFLSSADRTRVLALQTPHDSASLLANALDTDAALLKGYWSGILAVGLILVLSVAAWIGWVQLERYKLEHGQKSERQLASHQSLSRLSERSSIRARECQRGAQ